MTSWRSGVRICHGYLRTETADACGAGALMALPWAVTAAQVPRQKSPRPTTSTRTLTAFSSAGFEAELEEDGPQAVEPVEEGRAQEEDVCDGEEQVGVARLGIHDRRGLGGLVHHEHVRVCRPGA